MKEQLQAKPTPTIFEPSGAGSVSAAIQTETGFNLETEAVAPLLPD